MQPIDSTAVQQVLERFAHRDVYIHLEMTTGAYASHHDSSKLTAFACIRNGRIRFARGRIAGNGPFRVGLKMEEGWVNAEGLTHWEFDERERLLLAGYDGEGKLVVALQLSKEPF